MGVGELGIELNGTSELITSGEQIAIGFERGPKADMVAGVAGIESDRAPTMGDGFIQTPEFGESDAEIEVRVGVIGTSLYRLLKLIHGAVIDFLRHQRQTEPEMRLCRARLQRQYLAEATGCLAELARLEIGVAQVAVVDGDLVVDRDRLAKEVNRSGCLTILSCNQPQKVKSGMFPRCRLQDIR